MKTKEIADAVQRIVTEHVGNKYSVQLFGSRADGTHRPGSDCDFVITGPEKVPLETLLAIRREVHELPTLLKIDVIDYARTDPAFRKTAFSNK